MENVLDLVPKLFKIVRVVEWLLVDSDGSTAAAVSQALAIFADLVLLDISIYT